MLPELVERIASMLNHFLFKLVGDKNKDLKVKNPEAYGFDPVKLLLSIATIITHFAPLPEFGQAVVRDDRSYDERNMRKAITVLSAKMAMRHEALNIFRSFCNRCVELKAATEEAEAELGEVPDEFLCEITADIMDDPVLLPSGKVTDRKNICRHLLSDETDPYSRARLTVDMLVSDTALKARIETFRQSRKRITQESGAESMDVE
jgi:ubiquitin conjugation factor E4 B